MVASFTDAWIETPLVCCESATPPLHPLRMRELKQPRPV